MKRFLTSVLALGLSYPALAVEFTADDSITTTIEEVATPLKVAARLEHASFLPMIQFAQVQDLENILGLDDADDAVTDSIDDGIDISTVINYGLKAWEIVKANKPVVSQSYTYANAMPKGVENAFDLEGASPYQYRSYRMAGKNLYGMTVYNVLFTVAHQYGASYEGKGKFITSAAIIPSEVDVAWGYTVDLAVKQISVTNIGKKDDPVASLGLEMNFRVQTVLKDSTTRQLVEFLGNEPVARLIR